jgi:hypothetical protein
MSGPAVSGLTSSAGSEERATEQRRREDIGPEAAHRASEERASAIQHSHAGPRHDWAESDFANPFLRMVNTDRPGMVRRYRDWLPEPPAGAPRSPATPTCWLRR